MKVYPALFLAAWAAMLPAAVFGEDKVETNVEKPMYELPDDPKAEVIVLDYKGGFTPPRTSDEPHMTIRSDGTIEFPARFQGQKAFNSKLEKEELQDLLDFIIRENKFFEYDPKAVAEKLNQGGPRLKVADAAMAILQVTADGKTHKISHYPMGFGKQIEEIKQLQAIQRRLMQVQSVVQLGGKEQVEKWLAEANKELKAKYPDVAPLTTEHLASGGERAEGSVYVSFSRIVRSADGNPAPASTTSVFINQPAQGERKVSVTHRKQ